MALCNLIMGAAITPQEFFNTDAAAPRRARELMEELERLRPEQADHVLQIVRDLTEKG